MNRCSFTARRDGIASFVVLAASVVLVVLPVRVARAAVEGTPEAFPCVAHDAAHSSIADSAGPPMLGAPRFVAVVPGVELTGPSTPIVADLMIYVSADAFDDEQTYTGSYLLALDELDGTLLWSRAIEPRAMDSWSSPCVCLGEVDGERVECVVIGSGDRMQAFDPHTGTPLWSTPLARSIVNASAVIVGGRAFITDYTGFGPGGRLYALDVRDGAIIWSREIGQTSSNTPAYDAGAVYAATSGGSVGSYDAADGSPNWEVQLFGGWGEGFSGGVNVRDGALYAATYGFYGGQDNSTLLKLDAATGAVLWSVPAERTDSIPVVLDETVFLAGGVVGFGSRRTLECFDESSGALLWSYDGAGGWLHQPCAAGGLLYAGLIPGAGYAFGPGSDLHVIDAGKAPDEAGFVVDVHGACGSSPSVVNGNVYSVGMLSGDTALYAFGPPLDPWIDDVAWDQVARSAVIGFRCIAGDDYVVERADADAYDDALTWYSLPGDTITAGDRHETVTDDLTLNPLSTAFRFYRVKRNDGTNTSRQTAGVFEMPIDAAATTLYFISTPLIPDPDHNSVAAVFGEGAGRQIVRSNVTVSDLDESNGAISRMRNASGTYSVLAGSAFDIEPGIGYEVYVGLGFLTDFKLRLTGYVPEASITVPLTKENNQAVRWMGYSLPRTIKLSELGLVEAVTPLWAPTNKVRLLPPGSPGWFNYTYDTGTSAWSPSDPDLLPGMGIVFIRAGFDNLTDELELTKWYLSPPNTW